jgi:predicted nucleic acid-binding protein
VDKPTVYLDTNIISAYWYEGNDLAAAARRLHSREWWNEERKHFSVYVSVTTINELRAGSFRRQADCVKMARALPRLAMTRKAKHVLDELLKSRLIPVTKPGDALQMAVSPAHEVDYLLTWNYAHLANPVAQERLEVVCRGLQLRSPLLVSPETIPQARFGQTIRRRIL